MSEGELNELKEKVRRLELELNQRIAKRDISEALEISRRDEITSLNNLIIAELERQRALPQAVAAISDCTKLKIALLNAKLEDDYLCLTDGYVFPIGGNILPSKLLVRDFHKEIKLMLQFVRTSKRRFGGAVFFGPSGIGKSWAAMSVLIDELKDAEKTGKCIIYFDATADTAFVFSKHRCAKIKNVIGGPNMSDMPELEDVNTVLIYDASSGSTAQLKRSDCEYLIFSSPHAGNYKQVARNNDLARFICPNWNLDELIKLAHGFDKDIPVLDIQNTFDEFGGSPRYIVAVDADMSIAQKNEAVTLWKNIKNLAATKEWPSSLIQATYKTTEVAETAQQAYEKYKEKNVQWDFASIGIYKLLMMEYGKIETAEKLSLESWLMGTSSGLVLYGHLFENKVETMMRDKFETEIKALNENEGLSVEEKQILNKELAKVPRILNWTYTPFLEVQMSTLSKEGQHYHMNQLCNLNNPKVLYRMPPGFPLMDFYNPPNNCFSVNIGQKHAINLNHAEDLCNELIAKKNEKGEQVQQINFIHVTTEHTYNNMNRWQSFALRGGKQQALGKLSSEKIGKLSRIVQFCLRFKKL